ncbi:MAG: serine/threonine protein kinase, partial [Chloroflexi bacterium]|nr:serine/threonine protein kinase [Chloroflexota bacterium]NOG37301.1 serine/threonine protein kinase [Chloroflexota bacterium]
MAIPAKIGRYEILSKIAGGGMAVVYLARDPRVGRQVAVKVLYEHLAQDPQIRERFKREAETIATLEHPAIVPLYDFGEEEESLYLVMRYMQGGTLAARIKEGGMPVAEIVPIMQRVGAALAEAHGQNIIHRDLKPGNILFDHTNRAYLSDFGIARLLEATMTATDAMMGTPAYMSPEQVRGPKEVDYRSDIYGLGVILFEMLTGQRPFAGDTPLEQATARILYPPPYPRDFNAALPEGWDWVVQKVLARDKMERYQQVMALVADVEAVADGRTAMASLFPVTPAAAAPPPPTITSPL